MSLVQGDCDSLYCLHQWMPTAAAAAAAELLDVPRLTTDHAVHDACQSVVDMVVMTQNWQTLQAQQTHYTRITVQHH